MAGTQRTQLLLLLFVGTMLLAISLADAACGNTCDCNSRASCESGAAKDFCCWSGNKCKNFSFKSDRNNCGSCRNRCSASEDKCCDSKCSNSQSDINNCGNCGNKCTDGKLCNKGQCK